MLILILSIFINLIIIYFVYNNLIAKIQFPHKQETSEIQSIMVELNKLTKNNVDLIEEKIEELKNIIKIADSKISQLNSLLNIIQKNEVESIPKKKNIPIEPKKEDKYTIIKNLLKKKMTPLQIAKHLGISIEEVKLYINLIENEK
jgi:hypothetical protein